MKRNAFYAGILIIILIVGSYIYIGASDDKDGIREHGKKILETIEKNNSQAIASITNGEKTIELTKLQLDTFIMNLEFINKEKVDRNNALNSLIKQRALYMIACDEGYEVNDEEVEDKVAETQNVIKSDIEQQTFLKNYLSGLNISEEDYYKHIFDSYKVRLTIGNYKNNKLKKELMKIDSSLICKENSLDYNKALDKYIDEIYNQKMVDREILVEYFIIDSEN